MDYITQKKGSIANLTEQYKAEMKRFYAIAQKRCVITEKEANSDNQKQSTNKDSSEKENTYNDFKVFDGINVYEENEIEPEHVVNDEMYFDVEKYDLNDSLAQPNARIKVEANPHNVTSSNMRIAQMNYITVKQKYDEFKRQNPYAGQLKVQAFTARRAYPVAEAEVEISKVFDNEKYVIMTTKTDIYGMTEIINLPAPLHMSAQDTDENKDKACAVYHIKVKHPYFMTMNYYDVPIYQDVTAIQPCDLIPKVVAPSGQKEMNFYEQPLS